MTWHGMTWQHGMAWHGMAWHGMAWRLYLYLSLTHLEVPPSDRVMRKEQFVWTQRLSLLLLLPITEL